MLDPNTLLDRLSEMRVSEFEKVNKSAIINLIAKSMSLGDYEVKERVAHIFRKNLLMG